MKDIILLGLGAILYGIWSQGRAMRAFLEGLKLGREEAMQEVCQRIDQIEAMPEPQPALMECSCCKEVKATHSFNGEQICDSCRYYMDQVNHYLETH